MWRELIYSIICHAVVFSGLIFPSFMVLKEQPSLIVIPVRAVTPQSIEQLIKKNAPAGKPKPRIPQVVIEPDKKLPRQTSRPKQIAKSKTSETQKSSINSKSGEESTKGAIPGIKVDSEFEYPEYLLELRDKIQNNWRPPAPNESLVSRVYFKLSREGRILRTFIEKRTGNIPFDISAMNAVTKSVPFSPLPEDFKGNELGIHMDFIYEK
ncbi:cell envelope integrity protein TolA [Candidatus Latescibacterota bacterium]